MVILGDATVVVSWVENIVITGFATAAASWVVIIGVAIELVWSFSGVWSALRSVELPYCWSYLCVAW